MTTTAPCIHLSPQALERGQLFARDEEDLLEIECGLHSGFPPCCVIFYVTVWWKIGVTKSPISLRNRLRTEKTNESS